MSKPKPRTDEAGARERIIDAAVNLFCHKGYEQASVREIVEAAGVTKPVLYYYFKNKEDLFGKIIKMCLEEFRRNVFAVKEKAEQGARAFLEAIAEVHIKTSRELPERVRFIHAIAFSGLYEDAFDFINYFETNNRFFTELFAEAQKRGEIRDDLEPEVLARNFVGMAEEAMRYIAYCPDCMSMPPSAKVIADIYLKGIAK